MEVTRYDGTRFITKEEIDEEFDGYNVLVSLKGVSDRFNEGYLIAAAKDGKGSYGILSDIAMEELEADAKIHYGCKDWELTYIHEELLDWA